MTVEKGDVAEEEARRGFSLVTQITFVLLSPVVAEGYRKYLKWGNGITLRIFTVVDIIDCFFY